MPPRPERPDVTFLFRREQCVQIASTGRTYVIQRQRYETREMLGPLVTYKLPQHLPRLVALAMLGPREMLGPLVTYKLRGRKRWVDEADLVPAEEDARAEGLPP